MKYLDKENTKKLVNKYLRDGYKLPNKPDIEMIISRPIAYGNDWSIQFVSKDTYKVASLAKTSLERYQEEKTI